jgi:predicted DNA-binding protein (UPF0251 family)
MENIEEILSSMRTIITETQELEALRVIAFALVDTLGAAQEMASSKF